MKKIILMLLVLAANSVFAIADDFDAVLSCHQAYTSIANDGLYDVPRFKDGKHDLFIVRKNFATENLRATLFLFEKGSLLKIALPEFEQFYFKNPKALTVLIQGRAHCLTYDINSVFADRIRKFTDQACSVGPTVNAVPATEADFVLVQNVILKKIASDIRTTKAVLEKAIAERAELSENLREQAQAIRSWNADACSGLSVEAGLTELVKKTQELR